MFCAALCNNIHYSELFGLTVKAFGANCEAFTSFSCCSSLSLFEKQQKRPKDKFIRPLYWEVYVCKKEVSEWMMWRHEKTSWLIAFRIENCIKMQKKWLTGWLVWREIERDISRSKIISHQVSLSPSLSHYNKIGRLLQCIKVIACDLNKYLFFFYLKLSIPLKLSFDD